MLDSAVSPLRRPAGPDPSVQADRLRLLATVLSQDGPFDALAQRALSLTTALLGFDIGIVSRIEGQTYTVVACHAPGADLEPGATFELGQTYCDLTLAADGLVAIEHMEVSPHRRHPCYEAFGLESYVGVALTVGGETWGTLNVSATEPRSLSEADHDLVRILGLWLGGALERREREQSLEESHTRFAALSLATSEGICFSEDGVIMDANLQFGRLFGCSSEDVVGRSAMSFVIPEHREIVRSRIAAGHSDPYEVEAIRADGSRFWVEIEGRPAQYAGRSVRLTVLRDVTRRRLAQDTIRFHADVLAQISEAVVAFDLDGRVSYWNTGAEQLHGIAAEAILGSSLRDAVRYGYHADTDDEDDRSAGAPAGGIDALRAAAAGQGDLVLDTADGRRRIVAVSLSELRTSGGQQAGTLAVLRDVTATREMATRLRHQAHHDVLTGLPNRARFRTHIFRSLREGDPFNVLFIDLDRFKGVNDTLGHNAGDRLLTTIAFRLRDVLGGFPGSVVARLGGDEFGVVVPGDPDDADAAASGLLRVLSAPVDLGERSVTVGASIGVAVHAESAESPEALLRNADLAMYEAKRAGRGQAARFQPAMRDRASARFGLEHDLRLAVERGQLRLNVQPIVHLSSGAISGFESLVRWEHPTLGRLSPDRFVPLAEEIGTITDIDRWVLAEACRLAARWPASPGGRPLTVSVNCSDRTFLHADLAATVRAACAEAGLAPERLLLELTERALVETGPGLDALAAARAEGVRVVIDDFGSGFSSLGLLHALPVDGLKIDRSFVDDLSHSISARAVVRAAVRLAADLGMSSVAEGVETWEQVALLREAGADLAQGYVFSPPVEADAAPAMLDAPPWLAGWR